MNGTYGFIHLVLRGGFGVEEFVRARGRELFGGLSEEQEVVEEESVELLIALGLEQFPTVEEFSGPQTVGQGVQNQILIMKNKYIHTQFRTNLYT